MTELTGRIATIGDRKKFYYLTIRAGDKEKDIPVIVDKTIMPFKPSLFSSVKFYGDWGKSPKGDLEFHTTRLDDYFEFKIEDLKIPHIADPPADVLRPLHSQRLLTKKYQEIVRKYALLTKAVRKACEKTSLLEVRAPFITFSDCEGAGEVFKVQSDIKDFFKKQAFLTVSGQVDEETITSRLCCGTYIFGPSFRSDPSDTRFHVAEFYHLEPEVPFLDLEGLMDLEETIIKETIKYSLKYGLKIPDVISGYCDDAFARCSYGDAIKILEESGVTFEKPVYWGIDLTKEHERYICEKHFGKPTFMFRLPAEIKSFYMPITEGCDPERITCESVDLLVPGIGELCGGSVREHRYDVLLEKIKSKGLKPEDYEEYLSLRKQGGPPTAGFGLGWDRFVMWVLELDSIRDVAPFPRYFRF